MQPSVPDFYKDKTILVTGGTGFVGKVLLEKLLNSCPEIRCIYVLARPKSGQSPQQRIKEITQQKLFDRLREKMPDFEGKIQAVNGDLLEPALGINDKDRQEIQAHTNIVFHVAATVKFDEKLKLSLQMNVVGTQNMVELSKGINNLQAFLHVSTAYANCDKPVIEETIYPPPIQPRRLLDAIEWMDDDLVTLITPRLLGARPNTYTYTKALAEYVLVEERDDMPVAIVRPSIVGAVWKEPLPGWIDNFQGASGLFIATGKGLLRSMRADANAVADIIPVDLTVNTIITAAWKLALERPANIPVYNCTTGGVNPVKWGKICSMLPKIYYKTPLDNVFRRPKANITNNQLMHNYWNVVSHRLPGYIADFFYLLMGKKPRMVHNYDKLCKAIRTLQYFTTHSWQWLNSNTELLKAALNDDDRKTFYIDARDLDWPTYLEQYCLGTKKFILNEDLSDLPAAKRQIKMLRNIRYAFNTTLCTLLLCLLIARSQLARNSHVWHLVTMIFFKLIRFCHLSPAPTD